MHPVEEPTLVENGSAPCVQILGLGAVHLPPAKAHDPASAVLNREHEPPAEHIPVPAVAVLVNHSGQRKLLLAVALGRKEPLQRLSFGGADSQTECLDGFPRHTPALQVVPSPGAGGRRQPFLEESGRLLVDEDQGVSLCRASSGGLFGYVHPRLLGKAPKGFPEVQVLHAHQEGEDVAAGGASAETAPRLSIREDVEGRGALVVEGAVGLVAAARTLQGCIVGNQVQDVHAAFNVVGYGHPSPSVPAIYTILPQAAGWLPKNSLPKPAPSWYNWADESCHEDPRYEDKRVSDGSRRTGPCPASAVVRRPSHVGTRWFSGQAALRRPKGPLRDVGQETNGRLGDRSSLRRGRRGKFPLPGSYTQRVRRLGLVPRPGGQGREMGQVLDPGPPHVRSSTPSTKTFSSL